MRIANALVNGKPRLVASEGNGLWMDLTAAGVAPSTILQALEDGGLQPERLRGAAASPVLAEQEVQFRAPFARPGQIIAMARNYSAHAKESTLPAPHEP